MNDLETLKVIREKEDSINSRMQEIKAEKDKELEEIENGLAVAIREKEESLALQMSKEIEDTRQKASQKAEAMRRDGRARASRIKLKINDEEIGKYVTEAIESYLGE